jgi:nitrite reductase/ring-hydroxylating ferredoxin subunit
MPFERALAVGDLAPGAHTKLRLAERPILLANLDGQFHAIQDTCVHRGGSLSAGLIEGQTVICPLHYWGFDLKSGICTQVPSMALKTFTTKVENGEVYVEV